MNPDPINLSERNFLGESNQGFDDYSAVITSKPGKIKQNQLRLMNTYAR